MPDRFLLFIVGACLNFMLMINQAVAMSSFDEDEDALIDEHPVAEQRQDIFRSKETIEDIKSKKPFVNVREEKIWTFGDEEEEEPVDLDLDSDLEWLGQLIQFMAMITEAALWLLPVLIAFYLYRYREYWINLVQGHGFIADDKALPDTLFGLDIREESLPDDIEKVAQQLWQEQQYREAVSLLYRGALVALFKTYRFDLSPGATEQDCIDQLESNFDTAKNNSISVEDTSSFDQFESKLARFKLLTQVWIQTAYAHRLPNDTVFGDICHGWNQLFQSTGVNA